MEELKNNVKKLVTSAFNIQLQHDPETRNTASLLVGKRIKQKFLDKEGMVIWSPGKVISQVLR